MFTVSPEEWRRGFGLWLVIVEWDRGERFEEQK
jgi:hypothetical protein